MAHPKVDDAVTVALEAIHDAAPGLLTMTEAAEKAAENAGVTVSTARNWLRIACEAGDLIELKPSRWWGVDLPGETAAGVGPFRITTKRTGPRAIDRRPVITDDPEATRPSPYGPGRTTYLVDPQQAREYVQALADQKKAKAQAEAAARKDDEKAQRQEIGRRFPGLRRLLRRLEFVGQDTREDSNRTRATMLEADLRLSAHRNEDVDITERRVHLDIRVWGDANVAIMQSILEAGISAHIADQPLVLCKHCDGRILRTTGDRQWWWHVDTTNASCAEGDTKAEPAKEN